MFRYICFVIYVSLYINDFNVFLRFGWMTQKNKKYFFFYEKIKKPFKLKNNG